MEEPRTRLAAMVAGLDVRYGLGEGHPLLGRRMPDLDLVTADGPRRVVALLRDARPVLLGLGGRGDVGIAPWADRVRSIDAACAAGPWELPVLGRVAPPPPCRSDSMAASPGWGTGPRPDGAPRWRPGSGRHDAPRRPSDPNPERRRRRPARAVVRAGMHGPDRRAGHTSGAPVSTTR